jgi:hypothetical protein
MSMTRFVRRLFNDTGGQIMLFGAIMMVALLAFTLMIPNGTQVVTQKMRAQTATDAGAYTGSVWLARSLNLNANMNIGVRSVYTWMAVLTMGSALSKALYTDLYDASVYAMGQNIAYALFNNHDPAYVSQYVYPVSIKKLAETAHWLEELQDDVAATFPVVGQEIAAAEARRNASGGNPGSENPGAEVLIVTNTVDTLTGDTIPMLVETATGDGLLYSELFDVAASLESIPTMDENIGPATGLIFVDTATMDFSAYYGMASNWLTLVQKLRPAQTRVNQWYAIDPVEPDTQDFLFTAHRYYPDHTDPAIDSALGKSWLTPNPYIWFIDSLKGRPGWRCYGKKSYSVPKEGDTAWVHQRHWKLYTSPGDTGWHTLPPEDTADEAYALIGEGYEIIESGAFFTDFYNGAESTDGYLGSKIRPRRLNPDREFHAVSYVWRTGANSSPRGPGPRYGGGLFNRGGVPAPMPMVTIARSVPYLAIDSPTEEDFFYSPNWDTRLTPLDETALQDMATGEAYAKLEMGSFNLEELRSYVVLP